MYTNYKKISFILGILAFILLMTETSYESKIRESLLSLVGVAATEGEDLTNSAPQSLLQTVEDGRYTLINFLDTQENQMEIRATTTESSLSIIYKILEYILKMFGFVAGYVIIFYPLILLIFYYIWGSRLFKKNYDY